MTNLGVDTNFYQFYSVFADCRASGRLRTSAHPSTKQSGCSSDLSGRTGPPRYTLGSLTVHQTDLISCDVFSFFIFFLPSFFLSRSLSLSLSWTWGMVRSPGHHAHPTCCWVQGSEQRMQNFQKATAILSLSLSLPGIRYVKPDGRAALAARRETTSEHRAFVDNPQP